MTYTYIYCYQPRPLPTHNVECEPPTSLLPNAYFLGNACVLHVYGFCVLCLKNSNKLKYVFRQNYLNTNKDEFLLLAQAKLTLKTIYFLTFL